MPTQARLAALAHDAYTAAPDWRAPGDVQAVYVDERDACVIAFRGTVDLLNWDIDLDADPRWRWPFGVVHDGFWRAATELWSQMRGLVRASTMPVHFAGHSLGGALAVACAALYLREGGAHCTVTALAPPRVGGLFLRFALVGADLHLYRRADDLVPLVPRLFGLYGQPARLIHLDPDLILGPLAAHDCAGYVAAIARLAEKGPLMAENVQFPRLGGVIADLLALGEKLADNGLLGPQAAAVQRIVEKLQAAGPEIRVFAKIAGGALEHVHIRPNDKLDDVGPGRAEMMQ